MRRCKLILATTAIVAGAALMPAAGTAATKQRAIVDHVADGDTIKVVLGGHQEYVRFIGIDTPEVYESSEDQASAAGRGAWGECGGF